MKASSQFESISPIDYRYRDQEYEAYLSKEIFTAYKVKV